MAGPGKAAEAIRATKMHTTNRRAPPFGATRATGADGSLTVARILMRSTPLAGSRGGKLEDEQRAAFGAGGDHLFTDWPEEGGNRERTTGDHREVLLAAQLVRHRSGADARARLELPERAPGLGVERFEPPFEIAVKDEPARGAEHPAHEQQLVLVAPDLLLLHGIPGHDFAEMAARPALAQVELNGQVEGATLVLRLHAFQIHAQVHRRYVHETSLEAVAHRHPVFPADEVRADVLRLEAQTRSLVGVLDWTARGHVDGLGPVEVDEFLGRLELAVATVQNIEETVPIGLERHRRLLPLDIEVHQHELVDAVVVPRVVRRGLIVPHDLPGVRVDGERTGRVEVAVGVDVTAVVAADRGAPWRGIAGPVVEEIQRRIVRADVPGHAAPELPRVALPD